MPLDLYRFQTQAAHPPLDPWTLLSALALVIAAITVWVMRLRVPLIQHIPPEHRPFWAAFSLGLSLLALGAAYDVAARLGVLPSNLPVAQAAPLMALACWLAALLLVVRYIPFSLRSGTALDALIVITALITLLERVTGAISNLSPGVQTAGTSAPPPIWQTLHLGGVLFAGGAIIIARYLVRGSLPASHAWAMGAMLGGLVSIWDRWGQSQVQAQAQAQDQVWPAIGRIVAAELAIITVYVTMRPPKLRPRTLWAPAAPWLPIVGAAALLALIIEPSLAPYLQSTLLDPSATSAAPGLPSISGKLILGMAILGLTLVLVRWGTASVETARLRRERTRLEMQNEEYVRLAISDPLTHLFNKGYFSYRLKEEWERNRRRNQPMVLIALDLDNFKQVNDRYGHSMGDELLADVGGVIRAAVRNIDCPCRIGGDEFAVILPQTDLPGAMVVAERLRVGVLRVLKKLNLSPLASVSCGVSGDPFSAHSPEELMEQADAALYRAKQAGKNRVVQWKPDPDKQEQPQATEQAPTDQLAQPRQGS